MTWFQKNFRTLIYIAFLVPILTVAFVSISHVASWYGLSNPFSWALYLSFGIEIAALSALAAISAQMGRKVYFPFIIVTLIQFIGNIFFAYQFIDITSKGFQDWVDLVDPVVSFMGVESGDMVGHKRFLALFAGGMLPIISLSFLHMLVKFEEEERNKKTSQKSESITEEVDIDKLSLEAGKIEAQQNFQKYTPTDEELILLEERLKKLNEVKFGKIEKVNEEKVDTVLTETGEDDVSIDEVIEEPELPIGIEEPETTIGIENQDIEVLSTESLESLIDLDKINNEPTVTPTQPQSKINKLSYLKRTPPNVSTQRI